MRIRAIVLVALAAAALLLTAPAQAVETRCGLSAGVTAGMTVPSNQEVHNEFDFLYRFEADVKYYLFWGVSLAGGTGYQYGQGTPERFYKDGEWFEFDDLGTSFWRAWPLFGALRVELWRYGMFNPYIGGGGGISYLNVYRKGYVVHQPVSNSGVQWLPTYFGLAGFDVALGKYLAVRLEGKYRVLQTTDEFFEKRDFGGLDIMAGINIYF